LIINLLIICLYNTLPIGGVIFLGWDVGQILIFYWFENLVTGLFALARIVSSRGSEPGETQVARKAIGSGCVFALHYGGFCLVHGVFMIALLEQVAGPAGVNPMVHEGGPGLFIGALLAMAGFHLVIFVRQWIMPQAWRQAKPAIEMFRPYGRVFVLHSTLLLGAWFMTKAQAPVWTILILCTAKALLEISIETLKGRTPSNPSF
jgi:hypothetical protein